MSVLTPLPISWDHVTACQRDAAQPASGAVASFVGLVRGDRAGLRSVVALSYEAYPAMAERSLRRAMVEARRRWSLDAMTIQHRLGWVEVGQIAVLVVVSAPHRADAYAASRFLIERIKHDAPIWKRAQYDDGTSEWVGCGQDTEALSEAVGELHAGV